MNALPRVVLETELPMTITGWGLLLISLLITAAWLFYLYR